MFLTSKLIACFIDSFTLKMKSQTIAYLLNGSAHIQYVGFWTSKVNCTQREFRGQVAMKNARAMFSFLNSSVQNR